MAEGGSAAGGLIAETSAEEYALSSKDRTVGHPNLRIVR
jgi:hypothetical protein